MQYIEALCNACTDRYASYGNNSLPFSLPRSISPPLSPSACYAQSDNSSDMQYCWQQHNTSDAVEVSLHPGRQVAWVSNPLWMLDACTFYF